MRVDVGSHCRINVSTVGRRRCRRQQHDQHEQHERHERQQRQQRQQHWDTWLVPELGATLQVRLSPSLQPSYLDIGFDRVNGETDAAAPDATAASPAAQATHPASTPRSHETPPKLPFDFAASQGRQSFGGHAR